MVTDLKPNACLTNRQEQVLEFAALGYSHKEIADFIGISIDTVAAHIRAIKERTGAQKAAELSVVWFCRKQNITIKELIGKRILPMIIFILLSSISILSGSDAARVKTLRTRGRRNETELIY